MQLVLKENKCFLKCVVSSSPLPPGSEGTQPSRERNRINYLCSSKWHQHLVILWWPRGRMTLVYVCKIVLLLNNWSTCCCDGWWEAAALLALGVGKLGAGISQNAPGVQTSAPGCLACFPLTQFPYILFFTFKID